MHTSAHTVLSTDSIHRKIIDQFYNDITNSLANISQALYKFFKLKIMIAWLTELLELKFQCESAFKKMVQ